MTQLAIFTAITVILAQISIPLPMGVPMTMQTFAVALCGIVLGGRKGFLSAVVYLILGAIGIPVFSNFSGGVGILLGPTGGFLLSFPIMAWVIGEFSAKTRSRFSLPIGLFCGAALNFFVGMIVFSMVTQSSLYTAFIAAVLPFIPTTIIKMVAAYFIGLRLKFVIN